MEPALLWHLWRAAWVDSTRLMDRTRTEESPLERLLAWEAVFASGVLFDGLTDSRGRQKTARQRIAAELDEQTDTDGTPHADMLPILPAWFASLVRATTWAKLGEVRLWNAKASGRFDELVRAVATMTGPGGQVALSAEAASEVDLRPLLAEAVRRSTQKAENPAARLVSRLQKAEAVPTVPGPRDKSRLRKADKSAPAVLQSDWAKLVIARSRWKPDSDLLAVAHQSAIPSIEFHAFGRRVLAGEWGLRVLIDGDELALKPDCDAVSWFSDSDADYLELQWSAENGLVLCRQALLSRGDHQLILADCISTLGRPESAIEVTTTLPLQPGITADAKRPLRELRLDAQGLPLRCFPACLPMERIQNAGGSFECKTGELVLTQSGIGGVYAVAVFDWHPRRRDALADWRTLTVTQDGRRLSQAEAAGVRLRIGKRQLLMYRSLDGSKAARAVLGYHHELESAIGYFNSDGEVEPLVIVE